jgi:hypothetical protein
MTLNAGLHTMTSEQLVAVSHALERFVAGIDDALEIVRDNASAGDTRFNRTYDDKLDYLYDETTGIIEDAGFDGDIYDLSTEMDQGTGKFDKVFDSIADLENAARTYRQIVSDTLRDVERLIKSKNSIQALRFYVGFPVTE